MKEGKLPEYECSPRIISLRNESCGGGILPASGVSIQASILYVITDFKFLKLAGMLVWTPGAGILEIPLFLFPAVRSYSRHRVN